MRIHVFYDNSNIWGGAHALRAKKEPGVPWVAFRVHTDNMFRLIEQGRPAETRILAKSFPPSPEELCVFARKYNYRTAPLKKGAVEDGLIVEQGVAESFHLKIASTVIDAPNTDVLVVATGDGNLSEFGTGFIPQIEQAIKAGWKVEVWSWSLTMSRKYLTLQKNHPSQLKLISLDPFYKSLTFVKPGQYHRFVNGRREDFDLAGRHASRIDPLDPISFYP